MTHTPLQPLGRSPSETLEGTLAGLTPSAHARQPELPQGVDRVLGRAMSRDPRNRHSSAWELLDELVNLADDEDPAPGPVVPAEPGPVVATYAVAPYTAAPYAAAPPLMDAGAPVVAATVATPPPRQLAPTKARHPPNSMVAFLSRLGVPVFESRRQVILNSYFAALMRSGRQACGERWTTVLQAAGLEGLLERPPPDDDERTTPVTVPSRLAEAIESVFGPAAPETLRQWGRLTNEYWTQKSQRLQEGSVTYMRPLRLMPRADRKLEDVLYITGRNLDRVRGERLTAWKQIDRDQFWVVYYDNLMVLGRRRVASSCYFSTSALEAATRWGGLANDWVVDEAECGSVTGTFDCVFTVKRVMR